MHLQAATVTDYLNRREGRTNTDALKAPRKDYDSSDIS